MGFVKSTANTSLFYNFSKVTCTYLFVYDDDIIITIGNETNVNIFINRLNFEFSLKYIGLLHYFLGIEMYELPNGDMLLKKTKYICEFLVKDHLETCKPIGSSMLPSPILSTFDDVPFEHPFFYRSIVSALQYITLTRPDIFMLLIRHVNLYLNLLILIGVLLREFYDIFRVPFIIELCSNHMFLLLFQFF